MKASIVIDPSVENPTVPTDIALQVIAETEADWILLQIWEKVGNTILVDVPPPLSYLAPTPPPPEPSKSTSFGAFGS